MFVIQYLRSGDLFLLHTKNTTSLLSEAPHHPSLRLIIQHEKNKRGHHSAPSSPLILPHEAAEAVAEATEEPTTAGGGGADDGSRGLR